MIIDIDGVVKFWEVYIYWNNAKIMTENVSIAADNQMSNFTELILINSGIVLLYL
jgi:hypothetical protein